MLSGPTEPAVRDAPRVRQWDTSIRRESFPCDHKPPDVRDKAWEAALVLLAFACLALLATWPLVLHLGRALPGDLGDPLFSSWLLGWDADRLRHGLAGFWDAPILFPSRHTVAFSEHMLGIAIPIAPVIWLTGNPILGYDLAFLSTYVVAGSGMYLLARELTGRRDAAFPDTSKAMGLAKSEECIRRRPADYPG